jgi:hypothetical protein
MMRTTKETLSLYTKEISWECIPRTFQDAIVFTQNLGLAYIWIDSLCIVQDDLKDCQERSGAMTAIYSNSYITLAAAMSDGPESGIYTKGERYHGIMQTLAHFTRDGVNIPILARRAHQHDDFPLRQRGWVFQERLLSPRTIVFAREEIIWECQENEDCECGERFHGWRALLPIQSSREDREETIESWRSVVLQYSTLDLTFSHDALPALSGIAQVFAKVFDDKYLAGLGKKTIVAGLLWYRTDETKGYSRDPEHSQWKAPSWSWVSIEFSGGPVDFLDLGTSLAQVLEAVVERAGKDPNGEVASGFLQMRAKASNATIEFLPK